jgi:glycosyl transferase family 17
MVKRRAWDTFLFCDELDLLEARLIELDDAVYRHVLVEAPVTFQGKPKPLHYLENRERFAPWKDKIIHVVPDLGGCQGDHWAREQASRDAVKQGLGELAGDDIFMHSDVDEIPFANMIHHPGVLGTILLMRCHGVAVNLLEPNPWAGTITAFGSDSGYVIKRFGERNSAQDGRPFFRNPAGLPIICGWHFSWLGGPAAMRVKARSYTHPGFAPFVEAHADEMYRHRLSPMGGNRLLEVVIDDTFPRYMREHRGPANWYWSADGIPG